MKLFLQKIFSSLFKWFCEFYPKDKTMILIGIPNSNFYNDNSKYFFEFLYNQHQNEFKFFLITKNKKLYSKLESKFGDHIIYAFSYQALSVYLRSKFVLLTNGNGDIFPFIPTNKKQIVVNMWHAITFKNVGYLSKVNVSGEINLNLNYFLVSSETERESMMRAFRYPKETFKIFGLPRNDIYFNQKDVKQVATEKTTILYLPTFRDFAPTEFFPFADFDNYELHHFLSKNNIEIIIKPHKRDSTNQRLLNIVKDNPNIKIKTSAVNDIDIQQMLLDCDILLTDYSSVYFDFLLLDRPIIYIPYDLEQYLEERGLLFDFEEVTCGDKTLTQKEFIQSIKNNIENPAKDRELRAAITQRFHQYNDGQASERLFNFIKSHS